MNKSNTATIEVRATTETTNGRRARNSATGRITSLNSLRDHLQWAIELEHSTIPPYFCALYSIREGHNAEATEVLSSVMVEEMLHLTLAANLLNAVGGQPKVDIPEMLPGYPHPLPHGDRSFEISLLPFCLEAIDTFLKIEQPAQPGVPPEDDNYHTIGQFYDAIKQGFLNLVASLGENNVFCGDPSRQIRDKHSYSGSGRIVAVNSLETALEALEEIVEQGEGKNHAQVWDGDSDVFHRERDQVAHYYRFLELKLGRRYRRGDTPQSGPTGDPISIDWSAVRPMSANPRTTDHLLGSQIRAFQEAFNLSYCELLQLLERAFNGAPQLLGEAIGSMYTLRAKAQTLMQMPIDGTLATAGPCFEYVSPDHRTVR